MVDYLPRTIEPELRLSMEAFGAVQIAGPKWCGKTTTSKQFQLGDIRVGGIRYTKPIPCRHTAYWRIIQIQVRTV